MPINNITQTISTMPEAGRRGVDVQTVFVTKQEDFQDHLAGTTVIELNTLKDQLNTRIGEINSTATTMNEYVNDTFMGSSTATTKAGEASTSASEALTSRNQASTFASASLYWETRASKWADNNYNVAVEAGRYSAKHWSTVAQNATVNKVDKVISTDNAIVRFDGTTGAVKNSSVFIDNNDNVGVGNPTPLSKFHVQGNIRTACPSGDAVNTRGIIFDIDGSIHGRLAVDNSGSLLYSGSGGIGYGAGSGGTVTQLTNKSTNVTLNKPSGQIITASNSLAAGATHAFICYNSLVTTTDLIYMTSDAVLRYDTTVSNGSGGFTVVIKNKTDGSLSETLVLSFVVIKGANS